MANVLTSLSARSHFLVVSLAMTSLAFLSSSFDTLITIVGKTVIIFCLSYLATIFLQKYKSKEYLSSLGKAVLITGCDTGFGNRLALRLNKHGFRVYATVYSADSNGAKDLARNAVFGDKMHVLAMDVTKEEEVSRAYEHVRKDLEHSGDCLWAVVNNAGRFAFGHIEWGSLDTYRQVFDVNVFGVVRVSRAFLPLVRQAKGRVVNVVSLGGRFTFENGGLYCMSKHTMIAFSDALRREMTKFGVHVATIEPGLFRTVMTGKQYINDMFDRTWHQSADIVKKDYGNSYLEAQRVFVDRFHQIFRSGDNIELVVDDMIDAIQSAEPRVRYLPVQGLIARIMSLTPAYIPSEWLDQVIANRDKSLPECVAK